MSMKRREDPSMLTGGAKYVADLDVPGMLDVAFVRSEVAHATISNIDVEAALAVPGVVAVFTAADLVGVQPLADFLPEGSIKTPRFPLAADRVRYVGEPIVAVVAENRYVAEDAAELVVVDYNELPAVTSIADATAEGAQRVHDHVPGNTWFTQSRSFGPVEQSFARATKIYSKSLHIQAIRRVATSRRSSRFDRAVASFLDDFKDAASKTDVSIAFEEISQALDDSDEGDLVRSDLARLRRQHQLEVTPQSPVENFAE